MRVFEGCFATESLLLQFTHRSYPSRRRACFSKNSGGFIERYEQELNGREQSHHVAF